MYMQCKGELEKFSDAVVIWVILSYYDVHIMLLAQRLRSRRLKALTPQISDKVRGHFSTWQAI